MPNAGDTFLAQPNSSSKPHLYVVISNPENNAGNVIHVNLTSKKEWSDCSCVLQPGDHPFVTRETVVNYASATMCEAVYIDQAMGPTFYPRALFPNTPVSNEVLERIQLGALQSPLFPSGFKPVIEIEISGA
jgi:CTP:molybdopterin cytidylyltransferase MocA